jgi:AcrR family transcriptional regulator
MRARKFACKHLSWDAGAVTTARPGLRERKKQATSKALRDAALRLALERGPDNVRVDDIAEAAGVSPRTYNNYFSSREQAIVAAVTAEREARVAEAVAARPASVRLSDAVVDAIVDQYTGPGSHDPRVLALITTRSALRDAFLDAAAGIEHPLTAVIAGRIGDTGLHTARVLSASVAAAVRIALQQWLRPAAGSRPASGLVVPSGSLPGLLRTALAPLAPALDAAEDNGRQQDGVHPAR